MLGLGVRVPLSACVSVPGLGTVRFVIYNVTDGISIGLWEYFLTFSRKREEAAFFLAMTNFEWSRSFKK